MISTRAESTVCTVCYVSQGMERRRCQVGSASTSHLTEYVTKNSFAETSDNGSNTVTHLNEGKSSGHTSFIFPWPSQWRQSEERVLPSTPQDDTVNQPQMAQYSTRTLYVPGASLQRSAGSTLTAAPYLPSADNSQAGANAVTAVGFYYRSRRLTSDTLIHKSSSG